MHSHDNPTKNRVRDAWMDFLPAFFEHGCGPVGLYLPGSENLELSGYQSKGITPGRLVGCERDADLLPAVVRNARGVRIIAGTPTDAFQILSGERVLSLRFANLDFEGGYETHVRDVMSALRLLVPPPEEASDLAVTSHAARQHSLRDGSLNASKFLSALDDHELVYTQLRLMERRYAIASGFLAHACARPFAHLRRELGFLWWLVIGLGLIDADGVGHGSFDLPFLRARISPPILSILDRLREAADDGGLHLVRDRLLSEALAGRTVRLWPTAFRHTLYYSPQGQPMQTWFVKFWRVDDRRFTMRDLCRQVWDLAARTPLTFVSSDGMDVHIDGSNAKEQR